MRRRSVGALTAWGLLFSAALAWSAPPAGEAKKPLDPGAALGALGGGNSTAALAGNLRAFVLKSLPTPLYENLRHWGRQKRNAFGKMRNEGRWYKVRAEAITPNETLMLDLRDVQKPEPGKTTFKAFLALDARVFVDRQTWRNGARLYSGSTRARLRLKLTVRCEATTRLQPNGTLFPDAVFRLRVLESNLRYDNLVVEHTAGVGGEAAKVIGDLVIGSVHAFRPSLERDALAKANAAVVKAGDTKEVRIGLTSLFSGKGGALPLPVPKK
jgi:hypothetical protein